MKDNRVNFIGNKFLERIIKGFLMGLFEAEGLEEIFGLKITI